MPESVIQVRLIVLSGLRVGDEIAVAGEAVLGRLPDCDLRLDEAGVSRHHARVAVEDDEVWIRDLGSSNGTKVGGRRVQEARLADGEVFELGRVKLRVRIHRSVAQVAGEPERPPPGAPRVTTLAGPGRGRGGALQYHRIRDSRSRLGDDLGQSGPLARLVTILLVVLLGALVFWFAYTRV